MFRSLFSRALFNGRRPVSGVSVAQKEPSLIGIYQPFSSLSINSDSMEYPMMASNMINPGGLSQERAFYASKCIKIHVLRSLGFSSNEITRLMLVSSLEKGTLRAYERLKYMLNSEADALRVVKQFPEVLIRNFESKVAPMIQVLQRAGVAQSGILYCLMRVRDVLATISDINRFEECVDRVKAMGVNPEKEAFIDAVLVMATITKTTWDNKVVLHKKCGWSAEEVSGSFKRRPQGMLTRERKITEVFDLLVGKLGYDASVLSKRPKIFTLSMEKTISPRCSVFHVLLSKGLVKRSPSPMKWLDCTEERFFDKFVKPHLKEAPELLKLYQEKKWNIKESS